MTCIARPAPSAARRVCVPMTSPQWTTASAPSAAACRTALASGSARSWLSDTMHTFTPMHTSPTMEIRACLFDVFGTVVDWRSSVSRDLAAFAKEKRISGVDWLEFAVEWRKLYQPSMEEVRSGRRPFTILDDLHRESLDKLVARYGIRGL